MNESILKALMQLFAIVATVNKQGISPNSRAIVRNFLRYHINKNQVEEYISIFEEFLEKHSPKQRKSDDQKVQKRTSSNSVKVLMICHDINELLQQREKFIVLFHLLEFVTEDNEASDKEMEFVVTVADVFNISIAEFELAKALVDSDEKILKYSENALVINSLTDEEYQNQNKETKNAKHFYRDGIDKEIYLIHFKSTALFVLKYTGEQEAFLNGHLLQPQKTHIFDSGSIIKSSFFNPIYQSDVLAKFMQTKGIGRVVFNAYDVEFRFPNSQNGLHTFNLSAVSGELIGIMGGSGVGKSTLFNILNGNTPPQKGNITINSIDIYKNKDKLEGVIGFVPQDDLLIEELTVFENLYYNAKLCFSNYTEEEIIVAVNKTLEGLDLLEIGNLQVGNSLNKFISGGQRKRLNIALELIRQPLVLFVDEPTSGLSSTDSESAMLLLKELAIKGKLIIVNIHQPSSDIYKLFDKMLIMDKGGRPIYQGNPLDAIVYFKTQASRLRPEEAECQVCGNVNPELVLEIVESKIVNEYGKFTKQRKISPEDWYQMYRQKIESKIVRNETKEQLPPNAFRIPKPFKQFLIFSIRNLKSKLTNTQYILINLLEAPLLALILAFFTKFIKGTAANPDLYLFSANENMPAYLFMAVIVSLFMGLTVSAEEIIKEQRLLKRESFLNLSRVAFINSKIIYLFALSAFQTLSFVLIGNWILEIHGLYWQYFFILFTTAAFANMVGLNISSALNSVVTIYILIPFILVPQILLSGTVVNFSKLNKSLVSPYYVPIVGDLMTSRWAYEALAVTQFEENLFERNFFNTEKQISNYSFKAGFVIPKLESMITQQEKGLNGKIDSVEYSRNFRILNLELNKLLKNTNAPAFSEMNELNPEKFNQEVANDLRDYLGKFKKYYQKLQNQANAQKDSIYESLVKKLGSNEAVVQLKVDNHNENIENLVLNNNEITKILEYKDELLQQKDPIFTEPYGNYGRAQLYASYKKIGNFEILTFSFNTIVIWFVSLLMYFTLLFDTLRNIIESSWIKRLFEKKSKV
jgi:ABC-type multidrug transport system ATPase subunit